MTASPPDLADGIRQLPVWVELCAKPVWRAGWKMADGRTVRCAKPARHFGRCDVASGPLIAVIDR